MQIEAPFDSDQHPKAVFVQGDDCADTTCDQCLRECWDFPYASMPGIGRPAAMFQAAIYCANCCPRSYDEHTGEWLHTLTGDPVT